MSKLPPRSDPDSLSLKPSRGTRTPAVRPGTAPGPDFSAVRGSARTVPASVPPTATRPPASAAGQRQYTVKAGDTLSHIAQHFYGKAGQWPRIFEANRDLLDDPDLIHPGQVLTIP